MIYLIYVVVIVLTYWQLKEMILQEYNYGDISGEGWDNITRFVSVAIALIPLINILGLLGAIIYRIKMTMDHDERWDDWWTKKRKW